MAKTGGEKIGSLYYSLGLDDSDFEKKLAALSKKFGKKAIDIKLNVDVANLRRLESVLDKMQKTGMSSTLKPMTAYQAFNASLKQEESAKRQALIQQRITTEAERTRKAHDSTNTSIKRNTQSLEFQNKSMLNLRQASLQLSNQFGTMFSIYAVERFVTKLATVSGEFELQHRSLQAILQDTAAADKIFGQIKELSVESPFKFKDLISYTKQLAAFSVPAGDLFETMKNLADVSAGLGVDMGRITLAFGQVKAASVLRGQELRQFTEAGIPLVAELAKKFTELEGTTVSAGDVFEKISKRMVSFEMVKEIFDDMTSAGGKFYKMQEIQAATLAGKISNLSDAFDIALSDMGGSMDGFLKMSVDGITGLTRNWETLMKVVISITAVIGTYRTATLLLNAAKKAENTLAIYDIATKELQTAATLKNIAATKALTVATRIKNSAILANPYAIAAIAIVGFVAIMWTLYDSTTAQERAQARLSEINKKAADSNEALKTKTQSLIDTIRNETSSVREQIDAYNKLNKLKPSGLRGKSVADIQGMSSDQVSAALAESRDYAELASKQKIYNDAKREEARLRKNISDIEARGGKANYFEGQLEIQLLTVKGALENLNAERKLRADASFEQKPQEEKLRILKSQQAELLKQKAAIESSNSLISDGTFGWGTFGSAAWKASEGIDAINLKLKDVSFRMQGVGSNTVSKDKDFWENEIKQAQIVIDGLDKRVSGSEKVRLAQQKIIDNARKELEFYDPKNRAEAKPEDLRAKALKARISLIKEAYTEYEKLRKSVGEPQALATIKTQYPESVVPKKATSFNLETALTNAVSEAKKKGITTGIAEIATEVTADFGKAANENMVAVADELMRTLETSIQSYKTNFEFFKQLVGEGSSQKDAYEIAFQVTYNGEVVDPAEFMAREIEKAVSKNQNGLSIAIDTAQSEPLQRQAGVRYDELTSDAKAKIDALEEYRVKARQDGYLKYLKIVNSEAPEGSGFAFNVSGVVSKMKKAISDIKNEAAELMLFGTDEQDARIQAWKNAEIAAIDETTKQKIDSLGAVYIKQELQNKQLWESYSNLSDTSLSGIKKMLLELGDIQSGLLSGKGINRIASGVMSDADKKSGALTPAISFLSGANDDVELQKRILDLKNQIFLANANIESKESSVSGLTMDQVKTLELILQVIGKISPAIENSKQKLEQEAFKKWADGAKEVTENVRGITSGIKGFAEAFGVEFNETEQAAFDLVDTLATSTDTVISSMVAASLAASVQMSATSSAANAGVVSTSLVASTAIKTVESASVILAIISAAIQIATAVVSIFSASSKKRKEEAEAERRAILDARQAYLDTYAEMSNRKFENIFGEDSWGKAISQVELMGKAVGAFGKTYLEVVTKWGGANKFWKSILGSEYAAYKTISGNVEDRLKGFDILAAKAALANGDMDNAARASLQSLVAAYESYQSYLDEISNYLSETFGSIGSEMMDALVSSYSDMTKWADNVTGYVSKAFGDMAKDIVYSMYFADILKNAQDKIKSALTDTNTDNQGQIQALMLDLNKELIASGTSAAEAYKQILDGWMKAGGTDWTATESGSSMAKSIQGVSEGTADKLVGIINSIRQDSAGNVVVFEKILSMVGIDGIYGESVKANGLLAGIKSELGALNMTTSAIHDSIKSVITPSPNGGMGFRVV